MSENLVASNVIEVELYADEIIKNFNNMYTETGSPVQPVVIDPFVKTDISGIKNIKSGETITVKLAQETADKLKAKLIYLQVQNLTTNSKDIMGKVAWSKYFDFKEQPAKKLTTVAPNGCIYFEPDDDGVINAQTIKFDKEEDDILISYYVVLKFKLKDNCGDVQKYYCIIDPIGQISRDQGT
ncbi:hypothetical protein [Flammeovirga sp. SJP92]|uniref:hypothetical protein n=1 Tax=Flammeovirga sp. SJP92 TaxID=1775430 RepID=UPI00078780AC|nr:hypothetical protein [Flammeovirga sp. SJP92]KXX68077.1 hypothetical protein AVL50_23675 [Flammeovirga sp. SJP92]